VVRKTVAIPNDWTGPPLIIRVTIQRDNFNRGRRKVWFYVQPMPRFSEKRRSSFELRALKQHSKISLQVGLAVGLPTGPSPTSSTHERGVIRTLIKESPPLACFQFTTCLARDSGHERTFSKLPKVIQVQWKLPKQKDFYVLIYGSLNQNRLSLLSNVSGDFGHKCRRLPRWRSRRK